MDKKYKQNGKEEGEIIVKIKEKRPSKGKRQCEKGIMIAHKKRKQTIYIHVHSNSPHQRPTHQPLGPVNMSPYVVKGTLQM